jgi:serine/threonine-protein phosphatase PP1 catalytic subunit
MWSDPCDKIKGWGPSPRGTGRVFGTGPLRAFLHRFDFDLVCRAHQAVITGYEFPFRDDKRIVTLFSATDYADFPNRGAVLHVESDLGCWFSVYDCDGPVKNN